MFGLGSFWRREQDLNLRRLLTSHAFQACALNRSTISPCVSCFFCLIRITNFCKLVNKKQAKLPVFFNAVFASQIGDAKTRQIRILGHVPCQFLTHGQSLKRWRVMKRVRSLSGASKRVKVSEGLRVTSASSNCDKNTSTPSTLKLCSSVL